MPKPLNTFKIARVARGYGQTALAKRCGCSQPTISAIERGNCLPRVGLARRLASVLRVDPADLFPSRGQWK